MSKNRISRKIPPDTLDDICFNAAERKSLERLSRSRNLKDRRLCIDYLWAGVGVRNNRKLIFEFCDRLMGDRNTDIRWQSAFILSEYIESHPRQLWPLIVKWGSVRSKDIRLAVACHILEHFLGDYFNEYFPKVQEIVIGGNKRFAWTLSMCFKFGDVLKPKNSKKYDEFIIAYCDETGFYKYLVSSQKLGLR